MKKYFLAAVLAVSSLAASAQIWVGGSLGLGINDPEEGESTTAIAIAPEVGYTLNEKWDVAVALNFDFVSCDGETANAWGIEPYARYTFAQMDKVSFFVDGGLGYKTGDFEPDQMYVGFRPGIKLAVNDNLGFVAKLGFIGYESIEDVESNYGLNVGGNDLSFGMYWAF
ncbi:MAG: outer membrane beta-barrel protein [Muribaculaceae bacterium]|nr:outer membrane beta-barrel protein [Muribaculaceae bacterium]